MRYDGGNGAVNVTDWMVCDRTWAICIDRRNHEEAIDSGRLMVNKFDVLSNGGMVERKGGLFSSRCTRHHAVTIGRASNPTTLRTNEPSSDEWVLKPTRREASLTASAHVCDVR